jgi:hypothetical protein
MGCSFILNIDAESIKAVKSKVFFFIKLIWGYLVSLDLLNQVYYKYSLQNQIPRISEKKTGYIDSVEKLPSSRILRCNKQSLRKEIFVFKKTRSLADTHLPLAG